MNKNNVHRNVVLYKLFVLFSEPLFWGPIVIVSTQKLGHMSLPNIYLMESVVMVLCVLLDVPTGALADHIGRKKVLIIGRIFLLLSTIAFASMVNPLTAWIADIVWVIGYSFQSNADVSFIYGNLKEGKLENEFKKIEGCAVGSRLLLIAVCSLAVGPLASINMRIPILLSIPFQVIPLVTCFFFAEAKKETRFGLVKQWIILKEGISFALKKSEILWIISLYALLMSASKLWFFAYNPYFEYVGLDLKYYGVVFFLLNIVAWFSSHFAYKIEAKIGEKTCIKCMIASIGLPIIAMGLFPCKGMSLLVLTQNMVRGFFRPFNGDFMNRQIDSENIRTTVLSIQSTTSNVVSIIALAGFGLLTKNASLVHSLVVLGLLVLILGMWSVKKYRRLFP